MTAPRRAMWQPHVDAEFTISFFGLREIEH